MSSNGILRRTLKAVFGIPEPQEADYLACERLSDVTGLQWTPSYNVGESDPPYMTYETRLSNEREAKQVADALNSAAFTTVPSAFYSLGQRGSVCIKKDDFEYADATGAISPRIVQEALASYGSQSLAAKLAHS